MAERLDNLREEAIGWTIRLADPAFDDWDAFTAWLEADPRHAEAYDVVSLAADEADPAVRSIPREQPRPIVTPPPAFARPHRRRAAMGWLGGAVAASLVAATGLGVWGPRSDPYGVATGPGERREIALENGTTVTLNGGSRVTLDHANPRLATLDRGEALFTVRHDESDPFIVRVGGAVLEDAGTVFNVVRDGGTTRVSVAEGAVIYNPGKEAVRLDPGRSLTVLDGAGEVRLGDADAAGIGGWRKGRLVYESAPLAVVAADLARSTGVPIAVAPEIATTPFTGVIVDDGDRARLFARLGPLLDVDVVPRKQDVLLSPRNRANH